MYEERLNQQIDEYLKKGGNHDFRNFIKNNVMQSGRFIYVIKFCNPKTVSKIAKNKTISQFVLKQIPEAQITRYYQSCFKDASDTHSNTDKIRLLSELMSQIDFGTFKGVVNRKPNKEKDRCINPKFTCGILS